MSGYTPHRRARHFAAKVSASLPPTHVSGSRLFPQKGNPVVVTARPFLRHHLSLLATSSPFTAVHCRTEAISGLLVKLWMTQCESTFVHWPYIVLVFDSECALAILGTPPMLSGRGQMCHANVGSSQHLARIVTQQEAWISAAGSVIPDSTAERDTRRTRLASCICFLCDVILSFSQDEPISDRRAFCRVLCFPTSPSRFVCFSGALESPCRWFLA